MSETLRRHVASGTHLTVGLSGGIDSVVLLHILYCLRDRRGFRLSAIHVNHGLSPNAGRWQAWCEALCANWGVALDVARVVVDRESWDGPEAAARRARYAAYAQCHIDWLALAHQRDDQAETVLFNLLRGTGVGGAAAMPVMRRLSGSSNVRLLRPLLDVSRREIEAYANEYSLKWCNDESNADARYARNFLRADVFPLLRTRFPGCDAALARAASHFAESDDLLDQLAQIDAASAMSSGRIVVSQLPQLGDARARNLIRHVLRAEHVLLPDSACLHEILRQVCGAASDSTIRFDLSGAHLHRYRGEIWIVKDGLAGPTTAWNGEETLAWGAARLRFSSAVGIGISREKLARGAVALAPRAGGERFRPDGRRPRRALKKILQELDVPPWRREILPLLWCGRDLVWVPGVGIDCAYQCAAGEMGLVVTWDGSIDP